MSSGFIFAVVVCAIAVEVQVEIEVRVGEGGGLGGVRKIPLDVARRGGEAGRRSGGVARWL